MASAREVWEREMFFAELARAAADDEPRQTDIPNRKTPCTRCQRPCYGGECAGCVNPNRDDRRVRSEPCT